MVVWSLVSIACGFYLIRGIQNKKKTPLIPTMALALVTVLVMVLVLFSPNGTGLKIIITAIIIIG
jgi:ABC-type Co2+ transport system permease subunit